MTFFVYPDAEPPPSPVATVFFRRATVEFPLLRLTDRIPRVTCRKPPKYRPSGIHGVASTRHIKNNLMWITGEVRDEAGRLLSGVDVELSGSELASSTRKVVTNSRGQYTIVDLRPGTYSVKFARSGFAPILREPIDLTTRFVATIVAHLKTCAPD